MRWHYYYTAIIQPHDLQTRSFTHLSLSLRMAHRYLDPRQLQGTARLIADHLHNTMRDGLAGKSKEVMKMELATLKSTSLTFLMKLSLHAEDYEICQSIKEVLDARGIPVCL